KEAEAGGVTSQQVNEKLMEIARSIGKVTDIVKEIAGAAEQQATGFEQIGRAVGEMDRVTQRNAASSEESSSAAEELSRQSDDLATMVRSFKLDAARNGASPSKVAVP